MPYLLLLSFRLLFATAITPFEKSILFTFLVCLRSSSSAASWILSQRWVLTTCSVVQGWTIFTTYLRFGCVRYRLINSSTTFSRGSHIGSYGPSQRTKDSTAPHLCTKFSSISSKSQRWPLNYLDKTFLLVESRWEFPSFCSCSTVVGTFFTRLMFTRSTTFLRWIMKVHSSRANNAYRPMDWFPNSFLPQSLGRYTRFLRWLCLVFPVLCDDLSPSCTVTVLSIAFSFRRKASPQ